MWRTFGWVALALVVVALVVVVAGVFVVRDAYRARDDLQVAASSVETLRSQVVSGDQAAVDASLAEMQARTAAAYEATHGPHWWILAHTPFVGPTISAVQVTSEVVDSLAVDSLPSLASATSVLDPAVLMPEGGRLDLRPFIDVAPQVVTADDAVQEAARKLDGVDTERVLQEVAEPVTELTGMVDELAMTTATASRAAQLLPSMLGAYGQRTYILIAQNNAEVRTTGGIPGAWIPITVSNGEIVIGERRPAPTTAEPVLAPTEEEDLLFTDRLAMFGQNVNLTPDFPRSGEIARAIWAATTTGQQVDGIVSVDPVTLQHILGAIGPVTVASGQELNGENAARVLLNEIYVEVADTEIQDAFFAEAATAAFDALIAGGHDVSATIDALAVSAREGRLLVWSSDPREQSLITGTVIGGDLRGDVDGAPIVGVYLNDASATKMSYYLDYSVTVDRAQCLAGAERMLTVRVDIASTAPADVVNYPPYISGGGWLEPGSVETNVMVYSPTGGWIDAARRDGAATEEVGFYGHSGLDVAVTSVTLAPGESVSLEFDVESGPGLQEPATVRVTPGARNATVIVNDSPC